MLVGEIAGDSAVRGGGRTLLEYRDTASPMKPYVRQLFTPGGVQILRDQVSDHKHHHGLMFALEADGVNFWEETAGAGTEKPRGSVKTTSGRFLDVPCTWLSQVLDWTDGQGKRLLTEHRQIGVLVVEAPMPATLVLWKSELSPADGLPAVKLGGHHYFGLGMRFLKSMDIGGRMFNSSGKAGEVIHDTERLAASDWCAYTAHRRQAGDRGDLRPSHEPASSEQAVFDDLSVCLSFGHVEPLEATDGSEGRRETHAELRGCGLGR